MNDNQSIFTKSTNVVFSVCDLFPVSVAKVPIFQTRVGQAKILLKAFTDADLLVVMHTTGPAKTKQMRRDELTTEVVVGYAALKSLGQETNDPDLIEFAKYTKSDLDNMTGTSLVEAAKNLETKVDLLPIATLTEHGFDATDKADLTAKRAAFEVKLDQPEVEIKLHKAEVADRDEKYKKVQAFVKGQLDTAAKPFMKKDPYFFQLYKKCRKLHLQGHHNGGGSEEGGVPGEFDVKVPALKIVPIPFKIAENKVYLFGNLASCDLVYWTQATPDAPTTVPDVKWKLVGGDEATRNSAELGYPDKVFLFVANESNTEDGEIAIDEVV